MGTGHNWTTMAQLCSSNIKPNRCDMPVLSAALRCGCKFSGSIPETILFPAGGTLIHRAYAIANCASFQFLTPKKKASPILFQKSKQLPLPPSVKFRQINWINCDDQRVHRRHHGLHHCARQRIVLRHSPSTGMNMAGFLGNFHGIGQSNMAWRNPQTKPRFYMEQDWIQLRIKLVMFVPRLMTRDGPVWWRLTKIDMSKRKWARSCSRWGRQVR